MAPRYIGRAHEQYKADTDYVVNTLLALAQQCGFPLPTTRNPAGRPIKSVAKFLPMAKHIAAFDEPPVHISPRFFRILDRTIARRKCVGLLVRAFNAHRTSAPVRASKSDNGHEHFWNVLSNVRTILAPRMSNEVETKNHADDADGQTRDLPLEGWSFNLEHVDDLEEDLLILACLLDDLTSMQVVVREGWSEFKHQRVDFVAVCLMTNDAIEKARLYEEEEQEAFRKYDGSVGLLDLFYAAHCFSRQQDPDGRERPGDDLNFAMYDVSSTFFWSVRILLGSFLPLVDEDTLPLYKQGAYGVYDPQADRERMTPRDKFQEDKTIMLEILPHFRLLALGKDPLWIEDDFSRGLSQMFATRQIPLWLLLAGQTYLDIHHILRKDVDRGFSYLNTVSETITSSLITVLGLNVEEWPGDGIERKSHPLQQVLESSQSIVSVDLVRDILRRRSDLPEFSDSIQPHQLLKGHPLRCGLMAFALKAKYQSVSVPFANARGAIMSCAHLYIALRSEKVLQHEWKDMELLLSIQDRQHFPSHMSQGNGFSERYDLALSAALGRSFQDDSLEGPSLDCSSSQRLAQLAHLTCRFVPRYCDGAFSTNISLDDIEKILSGEVQSPTNKAQQGEENNTRPLCDPRVPAWLQHPLRSIRREPTQHYLVALLTSLQSEVLKFSFDYLWLDRQCWTLLKLIRMSAGSALKDIFGSADLKQANQLPQICGYIIQTLNKAKKQRSVRGEQSTDEESTLPPRELLSTAASVMDRMTWTRLTKGGTMGSIVCERLRLVHQIRVETGYDLKPGKCAHRFSGERQDCRLQPSSVDERWS